MYFLLTVRGSGLNIAEIELSALTRQCLKRRILVATRGSHRQYKHPSKPGRITIAGHPADELAPGTLNSVLKQAGLKGRDE